MLPWGLCVRALCLDLHTRRHASYLNFRNPRKPIIVGGSDVVIVLNRRDAFGTMALVGTPTCQRVLGLRSKGADIWWGPCCELLDTLRKGQAVVSTHTDRDMPTNDGGEPWPPV